MTVQIIPIFLPYSGCPHRCIFCNEAITAGQNPKKIAADEIRQIVVRCIESRKTQAATVQIAFYGGNFTGIDPVYQVELLRHAEKLVKEGLVDSIRISTRPDYVDEHSLDLLKDFSVKTVEIGAQSMIDGVLKRCGRGHTSSETRRAVGLLKERGFQTGVHLMAGLPGDDIHGFERSVGDIISLRPEIVRIHPVIILRDTELAALYYAGEYEPLDMENAIAWCQIALCRFRRAGIKVIRVGLQPTIEMEEPGAIVAGPFHPSFRSLVEGANFLGISENLLETAGAKKTVAHAAFLVAPQDVSDFRGIGNRNMTVLQRRYGNGLSVRVDAGLTRGTVVLEINGKRLCGNR